MNLKLNVRLFSVFLLLTVLGASSRSQETPESVRTLNSRIVPNWSDSGHFSFTRQNADGSRIRLRVDVSAGTISEVERTSGRAEAGLGGGPFPRSESSSSEVYLRFVNQTDQAVRLFWIDMAGRLHRYQEVKAGATYSQHTYAGHAWMVEGDDGTYFGSVVASGSAGDIPIKQVFKRPSSKKKPRRSPPRGADSVTSGLENEAYGFSFRLRNGKLERLNRQEAEGDWAAVDDESATGELAIDSISPDGRFFAVWAVTRHPAQDVVVIESSPKGGGRAVVKEQPYRLPGDPMDEYRLLLFDCSNGKQVKVDLPVVDFRRPQVRWFGKHSLAVEKVDRGHQRFRLFVVDPASNRVNTLIDEQSETFIWTTHGPKLRLVTYLEGRNQVLYASECSGFRHLYLVDLESDHSYRVKTNQGAGPLSECAVTSGNWVVREIVDLDLENDQVDLMVSGIHLGQDPYYRHFVRASLSGREPVVLTDCDGDHSVQFSPDRDYLIASSSRVDAPPIHELRRASDGKRLLELCRATRMGDEDGEWSMPRPFHTTGRDGETEIWGNLHFPAEFDADRHGAYPVIEAIYAGPHDSHVPKRYLNGRQFKELTSLGFVVVQIDGMGTANRSKTFHNRCWQDLKDAGFPDRIVWMKAAAKEYPALDMERVGIYGTSAGGQNACGALLFHGDFYKAAYASCGCHDNRMDKSSWNEQWMGYPVDDHYAESSNIDHAHRLKGELFLVVGELDQNVPPESTYRLVDALIKSDKDFEFLMVPGMGHSDGGRYGRKKMREFFVRTLQPSSD